jgi:hypothetical protein
MSSELHQLFVEVQIRKDTDDRRHALSVGTTVAERLLRFYPIDTTTGRASLTMTQTIDAPDADEARETLEDIALVLAVNKDLLNATHISRDDLPGVVSDLESIASRSDL